MKNINFSTVCRLCLCSEPLSPIFNNLDERDRYSEIILVTTGLKVKHNDGLPQNICLKCKTFIDDSLKTRKLFKENETKLLNDLTKIKENNKGNVTDEFNPANIRPNLINGGHKQMNDDLLQINKYVIPKTQNITNKVNKIDGNLSVTELELQYNDNSNKLDPNFDENTQNDEYEDLEYLEELSNDANLIENSSVEIQFGNDIENEISQIVKLKKAKENTVNDKTVNENLINDKDKSVNDNLNTANETLNNTSLNPDNLSNESCDENPVNDIKNLSNDITNKPNNFMNINDMFFKETDSKVVCKLCQKSLSVRSIHGHILKFHPSVDGRRERCVYCEDYILKKKMIKHVAGHGDNGITCIYCNNDFDCKELLIKHTSTCSVKKKRKAYEYGKEMTECDICNKRMQRGSLRLHKEIKHKGMGPVCEHCGRKFGNKLRLTEHLRAKHGYEKYRCSLCEFTSASNIAMQNHERRHLGERPFACDACDARFHAKYLLHQHKHTHNTDRLIKCPECPSTFKSPNGVHVHRASCHSARAYSCAVCARAFNSKQYVARHVRAAHAHLADTPHTLLYKTN